MNEEISSEIPDWSREAKTWGEWNPGKSLLASIRIYQRVRYKKSPFARLIKKTAILRHRFWSAVSGADIPLNSDIGGGLLLPHPNGVVIHQRSHIGPNCLIFQQVTLGTRGGADVPHLAGHVDVGAGAKILGGVRIGEHALVGANSVVLTDVPANSFAVGIPAVVKRKWQVQA
ncbi:hypothetical protein [Rhodoferax sp.]|uniref:serine acetyltransferase n=1 Tax=Rhodoferax sp. TaxID=50421 RepID=UPI002603CD4A|nr:hypothetical protein [Rhodoferax sp.]MDD3935993.1 hypothetical protein [Rhodoferax sp.]